MIRKQNPTPAGTTRVLRAMEDPSFQGIIPRLSGAQERLLDSSSMILPPKVVGSEAANGFFPRMNSKS